jgi:mRNA interferase MazF
MTKKPTKIYNAFDVVLVPFPFIDSAQSKRRPALILSSSTYFNSQVGASVMAMITSKTHSPWPLDFEIIDLQASGLPVKSIVRMKFFTLDHRLILKKLGQLSLHDQKSISASLRTLFLL